jgi:hypothetical protein
MGRGGIDALLRRLLLKPAVEQPSRLLRFGQTCAETSLNDRLGAIPLRR